MNYKPDILGKGFESLTINQPDDYEGKVICTLVRKLTPGNSKKAVLHVHGFNDYFFHAEMAQKYIEKGFNFYALDLRKYGRSWLNHQKFNNVRDLQEYDQDIDTAIKLIRSEGIERMLLSGHSKGGLLVLLYAVKNQDKNIFDAIFLNSPFFEQNKDPITKHFLIPIIARLGKIWPDIKVSGRFSKFYGPSLHKSAYGEWDYNLNWKPHTMPLANMGWVRAIYRGQKQIHSGIAINKAVLVMHPARSVHGASWSEKFLHGDLVINVNDIARFSSNIHGSCKIISVEGAVHDLMLSKKPVREKVYEALFRWISGEAGL